MFNAPVGGKSLEKLSGKIYNGYGYDIQTWNSEHCSLTDCHKGVDFEAKKVLRSMQCAMDMLIG